MFVGHGEVHKTWKHFEKVRIHSYRSLSHCGNLKFSLKFPKQFSSSFFPIVFTFSSNFSRIFLKKIFCNSLSQFSSTSLKFVIIFSRKCLLCDAERTPLSYLQISFMFFILFLFFSSFKRNTPGSEAICEGSMICSTWWLSQKIPNRFLRNWFLCSDSAFQFFSLFNSGAFLPEVEAWMYDVLKHVKRTLKHIMHIR